jgi:hypothetical protein
MTVRRKRYSVFIFGEGSRERAFFEHLKDLFQTEIDLHNKAITIDAGSGGAPMVIIEDAIRVASSGAYRERFVVLDVDGVTPLTKKQRDDTKKENLTLLESVPICFDCMLLKAKIGNCESDCGKCKSKLATYVSKPTVSSSYKANFGKDFLESYSESNPNEPLTKLINIFRK